MVDLILVARLVATEPNVTRWTLTAAHPNYTVRSPPTTNTFIAFGAEDSHIQFVVINERVDAVGTVPLVAVPTVDLVKVKLYNDRLSQRVDRILLERVWIVLDEATQELGEARIKIDLTVRPTNQ